MSSRFSYRAFARSGEIVKGELVASSQSEALQQLRSQGLLPFGIDPSTASASRLRLRFASKRITPAARLAFIHELGVLLAAQLPLDQALALLAEQPQLKSAASLINGISEAVTGGKTLGEALGAHPDLLHEHEAAMIAAAEHGGSVAQVLLQLATSMRRQIEMRARVKAALIYPSVLLVMSLLTMIFIAAVLVPNLMPLFDSSRAEPPLVIALLSRLNKNLTWLVPAMLTIGAILAGAGQRLRRNAKLGALIDRFALRLPLIGSLLAGVETSRLTAALGLLLKSGMPLLQALTVAQTTCRNSAIGAALGNAAEKVASGMRLAQAFADCTVMPKTACHLILVGEETNRLGEMMLHISEMSEAGVQQRLEGLMRLLTPALTLAMGLLIGGLIVAVMRAILSVNDLVLS
jgi:general secretion pathway protein F